jgi:ArsR family transcriptional regulator, arsenate/arsenite/antimonite-responsive transcriptional repressor
MRSRRILRRPSSSALLRLGVLSEREGSRATEGESTDPKDVSHTMPPQGVLSTRSRANALMLHSYPGEFTVDISLYFCKYRNMPETHTNRSSDQVAKYADMFSAMGTEPRLRIMQLLLSAHPEGLVVGEIQEALEIPNSTLSHHLVKLKSEDLVRVRRESTFLRYSANTEVLQELLQFLYAECCTRNNAVKPRNIMQIYR